MDGDAASLEILSLGSAVFRNLASSGLLLPAPEVSHPHEPLRLDRWLWVVRLYRTRTLAANACNGGHVRVAGAAAKPSRKIKLGDEVLVGKGAFHTIYKIIDLPARRVSAPEAEKCRTDITAPEEKARQEAAREAAKAERATGGSHQQKGRLTKRDRRRWEAMLRGNPPD